MPLNEENCCKIKIKETDFGLELFNFETNQFEQFYPPFRAYNERDLSKENNIDNHFINIFCADQKRIVIDENCEIEINGQELKFNEVFAELISIFNKF